MAVLFSSYKLLAISLFSVSFVFSTLTLSATPYQFLMFTQQWPKAVRSGSPYIEFKIHGLWPSNYSVFSLKCTGTPFDQNKMTQALQNDLNNSWPDVIKGNNTDFWRHEYDKHGICSDNIFNQTEYFTRAHNMWEELQIAQMLRNKNIVPGNSYSPSDVAAAISNGTNTSPNLRCRGREGAKILLEVVVCYDHDGNNKIDCDPNKDNCGSKPISYVN